MARTHLAAALTKAGTPLAVIPRSTPEPGPDEILIQVQAIALNPVDYHQRDLGFAVPRFPAVLGSDTAGYVVKVGSNLDDTPPCGSRCLALASSYYHDGSPDYGSFQEYVIARSEGVVFLPDAVSFEEGAALPLAFLTALTGWTTVGLSILEKCDPEEKKAVLIWGGASSVGAAAIQSAKVMGLRIYTTASAQNHDYLKELGAHAVFDYNDENVVTKITDAVERDGVTLQTAYCAVNESLQPTLDVLKVTKGAATAKVAFAPPLSPDHPTLEGVEVTFIHPPMDLTERSKHVRLCLSDWLQNALASGAIVPSPRIRVEAGGLQGVDNALNVLKGGVSGTKIVLRVEQRK